MPRPDAHGQIEVQLRVLDGVGWHRHRQVTGDLMSCRRREEQQLKLDLSLTLLLHGRNQEGAGIEVATRYFLLAGLLLQLAR